MSESLLRRVGTMFSDWADCPFNPALCPGDECACANQARGAVAIVLDEVVRVYRLEVGYRLATENAILALKDSAP